MNSFRVTALLSLIFVVVDTTAAQFTVKNTSMYRIWVMPFWGPNNPSYHELKPGESKSYDSGLYSVSLVRWIQEYPVAKGFETPNVLTVKSFDAGSGITMNPLELGVTIDILNDGSYKVQKMLQQAQTGSARALNGF